MAINTRDKEDGGAERIPEKLTPGHGELRLGLTLLSASRHGTEYISLGLKAVGSQGFGYMWWKTFNL